MNKNSFSFSNHFMFMDYKLNVAQTHETAHQLHYTIDEFKNIYKSNRNHLIGKLKFFIDLYTDMSNILHINETVVLDNYYQMLNVLAQDFNDDDYCDVLGDYFDYLVDRIDSIFKHIDDNAILDVDEVLDYVNNQENLNFQEQQFIMDIYYANCHDFKIIHKDGSNEVDYFNTRHMATVNDYCREYNCKPTDVIVREIYDVDGSKVYTAQEFYVYLLHNHGLDLDFVRDFPDFGTIRQYLTYTINTLTDLTLDLTLDLAGNEEIIKQNNKIIAQLKAI